MVAREGSADATKEAVADKLAGLETCGCSRYGVREATGGASLPTETLFSSSSLSLLSSASACWTLSMAIEADLVRELLDGEGDWWEFEGYVHWTSGMRRQREQQGFLASHLSFLEEQRRQAASTRCRAERWRFVSFALLSSSERSLRMRWSLRWRWRTSLLRNRLPQSEQAKGAALVWEARWRSMCS